MRPRHPLGVAVLAVCTSALVASAQPEPPAQPNAVLLARADSITVGDYCHVAQQVMRARWGDKTGLGVLEQLAFGEHQPSGLTGILDGFTPNK